MNECPRRAAAPSIIRWSSLRRRLPSEINATPQSLVRQGPQLHTEVPTLPELREDGRFVESPFCPLWQGRAPHFRASRVAKGPQEGSSQVGQAPAALLEEPQPRGLSSGEEVEPTDLLRACSRGKPVRHLLAKRIPELIDRPAEMGRELSEASLGLAPSSHATWLSSKRVETADDACVRRRCKEAPLRTPGGPSPRKNQEKKVSVPPGSTSAFDVKTSASYPSSSTPVSPTGSAVGPTALGLLFVVFSELPFHLPPERLTQLILETAPEHRVITDLQARLKLAHARHPPDEDEGLLPGLETACKLRDQGVHLGMGQGLSEGPLIASRQPIHDWRRRYRFAPGPCPRLVGVVEVAADRPPRPVCLTFAVSRKLSNDASIPIWKELLNLLVPEELAHLLLDERHDQPLLRGPVTSSGSSWRVTRRAATPGGRGSS